MVIGEAESILQVKECLQDLLGGVPFVRLKDWRRGIQVQGGKIDLVLDLTARGEKWRLFVDFKRTGEPRIVRGAVQQLRAYLGNEQKAYGVIATPYIGSRAGAICKDMGIGFVDLAGNCGLLFDQVFIERRGFPNPKLERRRLGTLFAPKASRVLRVLIEDPKVAWQVKALQRRAQVSLGLAFKVKQRLLDLEYAREEEERLRLISPEELLRQWAANYSYVKSKALDCYGPGETAPELEAALRQYCQERRIRYAFTLFSGAARVAPFVRYARGFAYVVAEASELANQLGWKAVPSGANFTILTPFDEGLLYGVKDVTGDLTVSDIQLYLDLAGYRGRGEEAATFILEQRLRPRW